MATPRILPDVVSGTGASAASARVAWTAGNSMAAAAATEALARKLRRSIPARRLLAERRQSDPKLRGVIASSRCGFRSILPRFVAEPKSQPCGGRAEPAFFGARKYPYHRIKPDPVGGAP